MQFCVSYNIVKFQNFSPLHNQVIAVKPKDSTAVNNLLLTCIIFISVRGVRKRQSFFAQICPLPTPLTQIKMHVRKELPLCMGDGGEVRWGSAIICVCCKSNFLPFKQRGEYVCNVSIFSVLQKKEKKKRN